MTHRAFLLAVLVACGGASEDDTTTTDTTTGDEQETTVVNDAQDAPARFDDMTEEQKFAFMQNTVMPEMTQLFQEFDGERYAEFTCANCHGDNAQEVGFEMPNGLAPLNPEHIPAMFESDQPMAQFMTQTVWPRMYQLLGKDPYNPETNEGFGCLGCHAMEGG